jgi:hypothetical protein
LRFAFDGVERTAWIADLGLEAVGAIQLFDEHPSTFAAAVDDVVVTTDPSGAARCYAPPT